MEIGINFFYHWEHRRYWWSAVQDMERWRRNETLIWNSQISCIFMCGVLPHFVVFVCRVVSHIVCLEDTWSLLLESHGCTSMCTVVGPLNILPQLEPQWLGWYFCLRPVEDKAQKEEEMKDFKRLDKDGCWLCMKDVFVSVREFEFWSRVCLKALCANKKWLEHNKSTFDVFLFFCIFLFCQFICHPSPIKESIRLKHFVLLADKGISVWAIQWHSYLLCAPLNSHSKPNNHFLFKSKNADLQVNGVFILRFDLHTYGRVHASDRNESRYNIIGKKGWLPSKKFT